MSRSSGPGGSPMSVGLHDGPNGNSTRGTSGSPIRVQTTKSPPSNGVSSRSSRDNPRTSPASSVNKRSVATSPPAISPEARRTERSSRQRGEHRRSTEASRDRPRKHRHRHGSHDKSADPSSRHRKHRQSRSHRHSSKRDSSEARDPSRRRRTDPSKKEKQSSNAGRSPHSYGVIGNRDASASPPLDSDIGLDPEVRRALKAPTPLASSNRRTRAQREAAEMRLRWGVDKLLGVVRVRQRSTLKGVLAKWRQMVVTEDIRRQEQQRVQELETLASNLRLNASRHSLDESRDSIPTSPHKRGPHLTVATSVRSGDRTARRTMSATGSASSRLTSSQSVGANIVNAAMTASLNSPHGSATGSATSSASRAPSYSRATVSSTVREETTRLLHELKTEVYRTDSAKRVNAADHSGNRNTQAAYIDLNRVEVVGPQTRVIRELQARPHGSSLAPIVQEANEAADEETDRLYRVAASGSLSPRHMMDRSTSPHSRGRRSPSPMGGTPVNFHPGDSASTAPVVRRVPSYMQATANTLQRESETTEYRETVIASAGNRLGLARPAELNERYAVAPDTNMSVGSGGDRDDDNAFLGSSVDGRGGQGGKFAIESWSRLPMEEANTAVGADSSPAHRGRKPQISPIKQKRTASRTRGATTRSASASGRQGKTNGTRVLRGRASSRESTSTRPSAARSASRIAKEAAMGVAAEEDWRARSREILESLRHISLTDLLFRHHADLYEMFCKHATVKGTLADEYLHGNKYAKHSTEAARLGTAVPVNVLEAPEPILELGEAARRQLEEWRMKEDPTYKEGDQEELVPFIDAASTVVGFTVQPPPKMLEALEARIRNNALGPCERIDDVPLSRLTVEELQQRLLERPVPFMRLSQWLAMMKRTELCLKLITRAAARDIFWAVLAACPADSTMKPHALFARAGVDPDQALEGAAVSVGDRGSAFQSTDTGGNQLLSPTNSATSRVSTGSRQLRSIAKQAAMERAALRQAGPGQSSAVSMKHLEETLASSMELKRIGSDLSEATVDGPVKRNGRPGRESGVLGWVDEETGDLLSDTPTHYTRTKGPGYVTKTAPQGVLQHAAQPVMFYQQFLVALIVLGELGVGDQTQETAKETDWRPNRPLGRFLRTLRYLDPNGEDISTLWRRVCSPRPGYFREMTDTSKYVRTRYLEPKRDYAAEAQPDNTIRGRHTRRTHKSPKRAGSRTAHVRRTAEPEVAKAKGGKVEAWIDEPGEPDQAEDDGTVKTGASYSTKRRGRSSTRKKRSSSRSASRQSRAMSRLSQGRSTAASALDSYGAAARVDSRRSDHGETIEDLQKAMRRADRARSVELQEQVHHKPWGFAAAPTSAALTTGMAVPAERLPKPPASPYDWVRPRVDARRDPVGSPPTSRYGHGVQVSKSSAPVRTSFLTNSSVGTNSLSPGIVAARRQLLVSPQIEVRMWDGRASPPSPVEDPVAHTPMAAMSHEGHSPGANSRPRPGEDRTPRGLVFGGSSELVDEPIPRLVMHDPQSDDDDDQMYLTRSDDESSDGTDEFVV